MFCSDPSLLWRYVLFHDTAPRTYGSQEGDTDPICSLGAEREHREAAITARLREGLPFRPRSLSIAARKNIFILADYWQFSRFSFRHEYESASGNSLTMGSSDLTVSQFLRRNGPKRYSRMFGVTHKGSQYRIVRTQPNLEAPVQLHPRPLAISAFSFSQDLG